MSIALIIGAALCALVLLQCGWWVSAGILESRQRRRLFRNVQRWLQSELLYVQDPANRDAPGSYSAHGWVGYREFRVVEKTLESPSCVSILLSPADAKPLADFRPGQHLVIKVRPGGSGSSAARCYSISSPPGLATYRITVRRQDSDSSEGARTSVSRLIHDDLQVGDVVLAKSPAGHFHLDAESPRPIVMLAAGIGITPMISMLEHLASAVSSSKTGNSNRARPVMLMYGVRDGSDHPFRKRLNELAAAHEWLTVVHCYSSPRRGVDREGVDYHIAGRIDVAWLRRLLPHHRCEFYLCGPAGFMQSTYDGLVDWGVDPGMIHFESFGPSTVRRSRPDEDQSAEQAANNSAGTAHPVTIHPGNHRLTSPGDDTTLLELAEANNIPLESGCRSGQCGSCTLRLLAGQVKYTVANVDVPEGECLPCVAVPLSEVVLEVPSE